MAESAVDALRFIEWVESLLWRARERLDPSIAWQRDLSVNECAAIVGIDPPMLAPGDLPLDAELATFMYWPGAPCLPLLTEGAPMSNESITEQDRVLLAASLLEAYEYVQARPLMKEAVEAADTTVDPRVVSAVTGLSLEVVLAAGDNLRDGGVIDE